tara:strand:+ start:152 stop:388 length:237 start_codon:yes stop_codon:yes gene_type:complete
MKGITQITDKLTGFRTYLSGGGAAALLQVGVLAGVFEADDPEKIAMWLDQTFTTIEGLASLLAAASVWFRKLANKGVK